MEAAEQGDRWLHILKDLLSFLTQGSSLGISVDQSGQEGKEHRNKIKQAGISSDTYLPNYNPPKLHVKIDAIKTATRFMPLSHVPYLDTNEFFSMQCTLAL